MAQKDLLSRLADAGESAIQMLGDAPGAERFVGAANAMKDRLDELQRRVRGLERLEQRVAELERQVAELRDGPPALPQSTGPEEPAAAEAPGL